MSTARELSFFGSDFSTSEWLTASEAAIYLRLFKKDGSPSSESIRNLVSQGRIPFYKPLGRLRFRKSELQNFIESSRKPGGR